MTCHCLLCCCSFTKLCLTLCNSMNLEHTRLPCPSLSPRVCSNSCPSSQRSIQPYHPLPSPSPAPNPSQHQGLFQWVSSLIRWPKYWSFSFSISPFDDYSGPISFRMDWLDLLAASSSHRAARVFATAFLPRSKCLLTSWLRSPSAVIWGPNKVKSVTVSTFFPIYLPWSDGTGCHDLHFLNAEF